MKLQNLLDKLELPAYLKDILGAAPTVHIANSLEELRDLAIKDAVNGIHEVSYPGTSGVVYKEAEVCAVKNGISANYIDPYMRKRDPECMYIGDDLESDKKNFKELDKKGFAATRQETIDWLSDQELAVFHFNCGNMDIGRKGIAVCPANAGFFALGLALLQGIENCAEISGKVNINTVICVAPPFRHTHFQGKQVVVHNRSPELYEIFSYNLYPGPSAKKGIYSVLLFQGEQEKWLTAHASVVQVKTPYDNKVTIMHEGASGGGKSEMCEHLHRDYNGRILLGTNTITGEKRHISIPTTCELRPAADDMTLCHPSFQKRSGKLAVADAERAWFIRVDHIQNYGTDPDIESQSVHPASPLVFLNIDARPGSTALLWEHTEDKPGVPCQNPRFIFPRKTVPGIINDPLSVDIRSFGMRTPPCTRDNPDYGILGIFHVLPQSLAWLWRLVSPRGYNNPSIVDAAGMQSEGVGSFWPFATGKKLRLANILLDQLLSAPQTGYVLVPNQHVGAWHTGFLPQWIMREYLARRGGVRFESDELTEARCPLLGYALTRLTVEGQAFRPGFLQVEQQPEVGTEAYDKGAAKLTAFFKEICGEFDTDELSADGRKIIECLKDGGSMQDFLSLSPAGSIFTED